jgi:hypothetical protein
MTALVLFAIRRLIAELVLAVWGWCDPLPRRPSHASKRAGEFLAELDEIEARAEHTVRRGLASVALFQIAIEDIPALVAEIRRLMAAIDHIAASGCHETDEYGLSCTCHDYANHIRLGGEP